MTACSLTAGQKLVAEPIAAAKPSGLGAALPQPASKGSLVTRQKQIATLCSEMAALLQASEDCRIYCRECSGLQALNALLSKVRFHSSTHADLSSRFRQSSIRSSTVMCTQKSGWLLMLIAKRPA